MRKLLMFLSLILPWFLRRFLLEIVFGYAIHPSSRIGFAWILPKRLVLEANSKIGHFTVCKGLDLLYLREHSSIGKGNWITGYSSNSLKHFNDQQDRKPELIVGKHSAITHRHLLDCTDSVVIGDFTTFAGFRSQILTHNIDLAKSRQSSKPVRIGNYCFIGTNSVLLGGSSLPDYSVLGAKSLLNKKYSETYHLYAGVPARPIKKLSKELTYFSRSIGFVN